MAGQKERDRLVAQLGIAEALSGLFVAYVKQHREQIAAGAFSGAVLSDDAVHNLIQDLHSAAKSTISGSRDVRWRIDDVSPALERVRQHRLHRVLDGAQVPANVRSQKSLADDRVGETHYFRREVQRLAIDEMCLPALQHPSGKIRHLACQTRDPLAVEGRLQ